MKKTLLCFLLLCAPAAAKSTAQQGAFCDAKTPCGASLQCISHAPNRSRCEVVCATNDQCPKNQMCIKDGAQMLCHSRDDSL